MRARSSLLVGLIVVTGSVVWLRAQFFTPVSSAPANWQSLSADQRLANLRERRTNDVTDSLKAKGFTLGDEAFIRVIKESSELELWLCPAKSKSFQLYKTWPIARWSGALGPKQKEGDRQAPEGFYDIVTSRLNPMSKYHLSFNIGYPNAYDQSLKRTGHLIMIHGSNVSVGCYAMTDLVIEEIYLIVEAALKKGQSSIAVHCFPFRMTDEQLAAHPGEWQDFWLNLKASWDAFEKTHVPPAWTITNKRYLISTEL